jgi:micrococcal nuclease
VNKWLCDNGFAVAYTGQNKADVEALHMANREKLRSAGLA